MLKTVECDYFIGDKHLFKLFILSPNPIALFFLVNVRNTFFLSYLSEMRLKLMARLNSLHCIVQNSEQNCSLRATVVTVIVSIRVLYSIGLTLPMQLIVS